MMRPTAAAPRPQTTASAAVFPKLVAESEVADGGGADQSHG